MNPCAAAELGTLIACATAALLAVLLAASIAWGLRLRAVAQRLIRAELERQAPRLVPRRKIVGFGSRV